MESTINAETATGPQTAATVRVYKPPTEIVCNVFSHLGVREVGGESHGCMKETLVATQTTPLLATAATEGEAGRRTDPLGKSTCCKHQKVQIFCEP